jgi:hypothetical protein
MDEKVITKAEGRLRIAHEALNNITKASDYTAFCDAWYIFLVSAKNIYTILEQGAKISPQSRQWFGGIRRLRRGDPLLQYLFQARDDNEHGLNDGTTLDPGGVFLGVMKSGYSQAIRVDGTTGPGGNLKVQALDGKPVLIEKTPPHAVLAPVTDRGGNVYHPPHEHLGKPISDNSPFVVAQLALNYLTDLIVEAKGLS